MASPTMRTACVGSGSRGRPQHAAVTDVERAPCNGHTSPRGAQPSLAQARMRMVQMLSSANTPSRV